MNGLARPLRDRWIGGVCSALAVRFGVKPVTVRILTLIGVAFFGLSLWAYIILWLIIPSEL